MTIFSSVGIEDIKKNIKTLKDRLLESKWGGGSLENDLLIDTLEKLTKQVEELEVKSR